MSDKWKDIWNKRKFDLETLKDNDQNQIFLELKKTNGFDVVNGGLTVSALMQQYEKIKRNFAKSFPDNNFSHIKSIYEVGCGSGANLFLFDKEGLKTGGSDYSEALITIAKEVLNSDDITCDEAINIKIEPKYDVVLSNSVFSYFPNIEYAKEVLEKIYEKAIYAIGLIDIHDVEKEEAFTKYRIETVENYEERYKDLKKFFYSKSFFEDFAKKHNMEIYIENSDIENYWNNDFIFNCYMYKK